MEGKSAENVGKGIKQIEVIDMSSIETRMRANKRASKQARRQTSKKANKKAEGKQAR